MREDGRLVVSKYERIRRSINENAVDKLTFLARPKQERIQALYLEQLRRSWFAWH